jgi:hypothetical protein
MAAKRPNLKWWRALEDHVTKAMAYVDSGTAVPSDDGQKLAADTYRALAREVGEFGRAVQQELIMLAEEAERRRP